MATLPLRLDETFKDRPITALPVSSLRTWLQGKWALLLSHADDFACYDLESDRWLVVLRQTLAAAGVRPLGLSSRKALPRSSWVADVGGSYTTPFLEGPRRRADPCDLNACALRDAVSRSSSRFVMIIDESLRLRRTFVYKPQDHLPSLLDLAAMAGKLRRMSRTVTPAVALGG